jgi:apolipoprotein D and lipocalin family protein
MRNLNSLILFCLFVSSCKSQPPLETVANVDLQRYSGKWYEIASIPQRFQKGCVCTFAEYQPDNNQIKVINRCRDIVPDGKLREARGIARPVEGSNNSKLRVSFFRPFWGKYWIIELDDDYTYAVVGHPNREYLWILSRTPQMQEEQYNSLLKNIANKGFDVSKIERTIQNNCNYKLEE